MVIKFFNTLSKEKEIFQPIEKDHIKFYVCGPTVYSRPHIGNARSIVIYDLLYRFLQKNLRKLPMFEISQMLMIKLIRQQ